MLPVYIDGLMSCAKTLSIFDQVKHFTVPELQYVTICTYVVGIYGSASLQDCL